MYDETTRVLIVGGAVVGLSAATFLAAQGVQPLLVDRHPSTLLHPRARGINPRTVEILRGVGLEEAIFDARSLSADISTKVLVRAETLAGTEYGCDALADEVPEVNETVTPCLWCPIDQDKLEHILIARAKELGADLRYSTEMVSFEQFDGGVSAVLEDKDTGARRTVWADYMIAADGYQSGVRERLGIGVDGLGTMMHMVSLVFKADLTGPLRGRDLGLGYLEKPGMGTLLMPLDDSRWAFYVPFHPEEGESVDDFDDERCVEAIRTAVGVADLDVEGIEVQMPATGTKVLGFEIGAQVAERFRDGRVFLAGDAAHAMPPTGAFGASTGIQDTHNLAWKLAAVLDGQAGDGLLDTYDTERREIAGFTVDRAMAELMTRASGQEDTSGVTYGATILGYRYRSEAIVREGPVPDGPPAIDPRTVGEPGTRAPHLVLERGGERLSALDLYGRSTVLLTGPDGARWVEAAATVAQRLGARLEAYRLGTDVDDVDGRWATAYGAGPDGAVLVRPDGFVAWRSPVAATGPERILEQVLCRVLDRTVNA